MNTPEYIFDNSSRSFPYAKGNIIPSSALLDLRLNVTDNVDPEKVYISKVITDSTSVSFSLSVGVVTGSAELVDMGIFAQTPIDTSAGTRINIGLINNDERIIVEGFLVVGDLSPLRTIDPLITMGDDTYTESDALLYHGCIIPVTNWCTGIDVNGTIHTGIVKLTAGSGVQLVTVHESETTIIEIHTLGSKLPEEYSIPDESTVLQTLIDFYGRPIVSINGIPPDSAGNFTLDVTGGLNLTPTAGGLQLTVADASANYDAVFDTLLTNISSLNSRVALLDTYTKNIDTSINQVSANLLKV